MNSMPKQMLPSMFEMPKPDQEKILREYASMMKDDSRPSPWVWILVILAGFFLGLVMYASKGVLT